MESALARRTKFWDVDKPESPSRLPPKHNRAPDPRGHGGAVCARGARLLRRGMVTTPGGARRTRGVKKLFRRFTDHSRGRTDADLFAALLTSLRMKTGARHQCAVHAHDEPGENLYVSVSCFGGKSEFHLLMDSLCFALHAITAHAALTLPADAQAGREMREARGGWECLVLSKVKPECDRSTILFQIEEILNLFCMNASLYDFDQMFDVAEPAVPGAQTVRTLNPSFQCAVSRIDSGDHHYGSWDYMGNLALKQFYMRGLATNQALDPSPTGPQATANLWQIYDISRPMPNTSDASGTTNDPQDLHGYFMPAFDREANQTYLASLSARIANVRSFVDMVQMQREWSGDFASSSVFTALHELNMMDNEVTMLRDARQVHSMAIRLTYPTNPTGALRMIYPT